MIKYHINRFDDMLPLKVEYSDRTNKVLNSWDYSIFPFEKHFDWDIGLEIPKEAFEELVEYWKDTTGARYSFPLEKFAAAMKGKASYGSEYSETNIKIMYDPEAKRMRNYQYIGCGKYCIRTTVGDMGSGTEKENQIFMEKVEKKIEAGEISNPETRLGNTGELLELYEEKDGYMQRYYQEGMEIGKPFLNNIT